MLRKTLAVLAAASFLAASAQAATITASYSSIPTPGLSGFNTWTVHLHSTDTMQGFDFAGDGTQSGANSKGFFGSMNQLNPANLPTIYSDNNGVITALGGNPQQDSQFLVTSSSVTVPAGFSSEGPTHLQGIWAAAAPVGIDYDVAQIVVPTAASGIINWTGAVSTLESGVVVANQISGAFPVPEPASFALVGLTVVGLIGYRRRK